MARSKYSCTQCSQTFKRAELDTHQLKHLNDQISTLKALLQSITEREEAKDIKIDEIQKNQKYHSDQLMVISSWMHKVEQDTTQIRNRILSINNSRKAQRVRTRANLESFGQLATSCASNLQRMLNQMEDLPESLEVAKGVSLNILKTSPSLNCVASTGVGQDGRREIPLHEEKPLIYNGGKRAWPSHST